MVGLSEAVGAGDPEWPRLWPLERGQMPRKRRSRMIPSLRVPALPMGPRGHPLSLPATVLGAPDLPKVTRAHQMPLLESAQERQEVGAQGGAEARRQSRDQGGQELRTSHMGREAGDACRLPEGRTTPGY